MTCTGRDYAELRFPQEFMPLFERITAESAHLKGRDFDDRMNLAYGLAQRALGRHDKASYGLALQLAADNGWDTRDHDIRQLVQGWDDMATQIAATPST